jgi:hypothetical protein
MSARLHFDSNPDCPLNNPETFADPVTRGLDCTCPEAPRLPDGELDPEYAASLFPGASIEKRCRVLADAGRVREEGISYVAAHMRALVAPAWKTTPPTLDHAKAIVRKLSQSEREELFSGFGEFCGDCGIATGGRRCWCTADD